jgi:hypothetical protein
MPTELNRFDVLANCLALNRRQILQLLADGLFACIGSKESNIKDWINRRIVPILVRYTRFVWLLAWLMLIAGLLLATQKASVLFAYASPACVGNRRCPCGTYMRLQILRCLLRCARISVPIKETPAMNSTKLFKNGNSCFDTISRVCKALGVKLVVRPAGA